MWLEPPLHVPCLPTHLPAYPPLLSSPYPLPPSPPSPLERSGGARDHLVTPCSTTLLHNKQDPALINQPSPGLKWLHRPGYMDKVTQTL